MKINIAIKIADFNNYFYMLYLTYNFRVIMAIAMTAMSIGRFSSFAPDAGKAREAAARMFVLIDSEPTIDPTSEEGNKLVCIYHFKTLGAILLYWYGISHI